MAIGLFATIVVSIFDFGLVSVWKAAYLFLVGVKKAGVLYFLIILALENGMPS